jgi:hypothetical protein
MKLIFILMALPVLASTCKKEKGKDSYVEGKVVRISCASFIVQVTNDDSIGEDGWKDMMNNDAQYDNVFTANNACKTPEGIRGGATIRFKISNPTDHDCAYCLIYDGPPKVKYDITDVSVVK